MQVVPSSRSHVLNNVVLKKEVVQVTIFLLQANPVESESLILSNGVERALVHQISVPNRGKTGNWGEGEVIEFVIESESGCLHGSHCCPS